MKSPSGKPSRDRAARKQSKKLARQPRLQLEILEARRLLTAVPGTYATSWLGNSVASGTDHIQQNITGLAVTSDGTVFTNVYWDEGAYNVSQFDSSGNLTKPAMHTHGWGYNGGMAVAANADYLFIAEKADNENGAQTNPNSWPGAGKDWYGISRRPRSNIQSSSAFTGGKGGDGDTLKNSFLPVNEVATGTKANITGLAASPTRLYAADPFTGTIRVYDTTTMVQKAAWTIPRAYRLVYDSTGSGYVWVIQRAGGGQPAKLLKLDVSGNIQSQQVIFGSGTDPVAVALNGSRLYVADNGPDQNIKIYDTSTLGAGTSTTPTTSTLGSSLMAGAAKQKGVVVAGKFLGLTGVGVDSAGNVYVSSNYRGPPDGLTANESGEAGVLEKYNASGQRMWVRYGLQFVDNAAIDPGSENDVYSDNEHFQVNWNSTTPGSEWSLQGVTVNPTDFSQDMRASGYNRQPILRRLNGNKLYMFGSEQHGRGLYIYRFDADSEGESAIPSGWIAKGPQSVPYAPDKTESIWRDANGDGKFDDGEFSKPVNGVDLGDNTFGWWVDDGGDIWQTVNGGGATGGLRRYRLQGFDSHDNPIYSYSAMDVYAVPAPFLNQMNNGLERVVYDKASDVMYLAGYTSQYQGSTWGAFRVVARYDHWSQGNRTAAWTLPLAYSASTQNVPIGLSVAGDYVFVAGVSSRAKVSVYSASTGAYVGDMTPNGSFTVAQTGYVDARPFGLTAARRSNGEYDVMVEEDQYAKTLMYRWTPSGTSASPPPPTTHPSELPLKSRTETFPSDSGDRFSAVGSPTSDGNNFGFSAGNQAGGDASGEAGGVFARSGAIDAYADTDLGGSVSRSDDLVLSGTVKVTANSNFNGDILAGYFNTTARTGPALGLAIAEPASDDGTGPFRALLLIRSANGSTVQSALVNLTVGTAYEFDLNYNASTNTLSGTIGSTTVSVTAPSASDTYDAFGVGAGLVNSDNSSQKATLFFDDLTYSTRADTSSPPPPPTAVPTLAISDVTAAEGNSSTSTFSFTVTRSGDLTSPTTVAYATADGSATIANNDYAAISGTLNFAAGESSKAINVTVNGDTTNEADETFTVNLSSPTNATLSDAQGVGTITNDDVPASTPVLPTRTETFAGSSNTFSSVGAPKSDGNNFGFSPTNNAGGAASGEAGGTFARSKTLDAYADTNLGGTVSRSQDLALSGDLTIGSAGTFDGGLFDGYFNTAALNGQALGVYIAEPASAGGAYRGFAMIRNADGSFVLSSQIAQFTVGAHYTYSLTYNAATNYLSGTIAGTSVNVTGASASDVFNAFGVGAGFAANDNSAQTTTAYFDDLTYSAVTATPPVAPPPPPAAATTTRTETFPSDAGDEFVPYNLPQAGTSIGFSGTSRTTGSGSGEAGGVFSRSASIHAYADTDLGGSLSRAQNLTLAGDFTITANNNFNGGILAGFFNTATPSGPVVAFVISEPGSTVPAGQFRGKLYLKASDGTVVRSSEVGLIVGGRYHFSLTYNASTHILSGTIAGTAVATPALDVGLTDTFDAFGVGTGLGATTAGGDDATQQATAYFDNLTYTTIGTSPPVSPPARRPRRRPSRSCRSAIPSPPAPRPPPPRPAATGRSSTTIWSRPTRAWALTLSEHRRSIRAAPCPTRITKDTADTESTRSLPIWTTTSPARRTTAPASGSPAPASPAARRSPRTLSCCMPARTISARAPAPPMRATARRPAD